MMSLSALDNRSSSTSSAMAQQHLYSQHHHLNLNGSLFGSTSISGSGSGAGGMPSSYGSGGSATAMLPPISPPHYSQQQSLSYSQYHQPQQHHLGLADSLGWPLSHTSSLDVALGPKRHLEEDYLSASYLAKRARVDNLLPQRTEPIPSISLYPQRPGEKFCAFYMSTATCKFGASCKFDHPAWVPTGGIANWKENTSSSTPKLEKSVETLTLPERPGEPDCTFYMKTGDCKYGSKCKFNHPKDRLLAISAEGAEAEENKEVTVRAVSAAAKSVPALKETYDRTAPLNSKGLPLRPGQTDCPFYMKTGSCKYGDSCRFHHPENHTGIPGVPKMTQSHTSLLTPTGAGLLPGVVNDFGLVGGSLRLPLSGHPYPVRPGAPECAFYMKTGECKFGPTCKFHHPLNRFAVKLTAAGLPRREGEPACPFYLKTGVCRFESTCKFDHPPPGEFAAKASVDATKDATPL
ncbi:hypothetical protein O6H91_01G034700 [Diphasiastrum complanatum]|uniref:Uncharacterized protein n=1 Tax=Diphasiastrum complanatum TaxID=34168 RepID=A0ACC2EPU1_DIPCM|nr:hypothetical protein O6H91_01G034700 [Diphasiastrum complanatum]